MGSAQQNSGTTLLLESRSIVAIGIAGHDALHQCDELAALPVIEAFERGVVRIVGRAFNFREQRSTMFGQPAESRAAVAGIDRPFDQLAGFQPLQRPGRGGAVQRDIRCQAGLVGGFAEGQRGKQAVLQRRDLEPAAGLLEQRHMNLVQAADQEARPFGQRPRAVGLFVTTSSRWLQGMLSKLDAVGTSPIRDHPPPLAVAWRLL